MLVFIFVVVIIKEMLCFNELFAYFDKYFKALLFMGQISLQKSVVTVSFVGEKVKTFSAIRLISGNSLFSSYSVL